MALEAAEWTSGVYDHSKILCHEKSQEFTGSTSTINHDQFYDYLYIRERTLDSSIKLTTNFIEKFFNEISRQPDISEPNNILGDATNLDSISTDLPFTIHNSRDIDHFYINHNDKDDVYISIETFGGDDYEANTIRYDVETIDITFQGKVIKKTIKKRSTVESKLINGKKIFSLKNLKEGQSYLTISKNAQTSLPLVYKLKVLSVPGSF